MTGIEILASQEIVTKYIFNWKTFWLCAGSMFGIYIIISLLFVWTTGDLSNLCVGTILGTLVGMLLGIGEGSLDGIPIEYQTEYKVTVSDEVSVNEFLEKYEIIDQEGKIYTIREK